MGRKKKEVVDTKEIEKDLKDNKPKETKLEFISTGSSLLNLAISGNIYNGWPLGDTANIMGPSDVGKTLIALTMFAEAVRDKRFDKYDFQYQAIETGLYIPLKDMFGKNIDRMEIFKKSPYTIQDWQAMMLEKTKKKYIGVLDSINALTTKEDLKAASSGKIEKGGYRTEIPIVLTAILSPIVGQIQKHNGLLLTISQAKKGLDPYGPKWRKSGGSAVDFYSSVVVLLTKIEDIVEKVRKSKEKIGEYIRAKVIRSRITGKTRIATFPIYDQYGIDDVESMVDFLIDKEFWGVSEDKDKIIDTCGDFDVELNRYDLARHIEKNNLEDNLKQIVQESWDTIEKEMSTTAERKPRYS